MVKVTGKRNTPGTYYCIIKEFLTKKMKKTQKKEAAPAGSLFEQINVNIPG
jgi:hypothetical protein